MKNLRKHILRSLMGVAGLLTFTACYGPYMPPPDEMEYPGTQSKVSMTVEEDQIVEADTEAEPETEADVTAEL